MPCFLIHTCALYCDILHALSCSRGSNGLSALFVVLCLHSYIFKPLLQNLGTHGMLILTKKKYDSQIFILPTLFTVRFCICFSLLKYVRKDVSICTHNMPDRILVMSLQTHVLFLLTSLSVDDKW